MKRDDVHVLVPSPSGGLVVVGLYDLAAALAEDDALVEGEEISDDAYDEALTNHGIESAYGDDDVALLASRVRELNRTGDANAFWRPESW